MRCAYCHSYIPEGLPASYTTCPQCGKERTVSTSSRIVQTPIIEEEQPSPSVTATETKNEPFAPYFTLNTKFAYGMVGNPLPPTEGSISFGPEGFSLVFSQGRSWEKLYYRDLQSIRLVADTVVFESAKTEAQIKLYHAWLPEWMEGPRRKKAAVFCELLGRVKNGLSPEEVKSYQARLQ